MSIMACRACLATNVVLYRITSQYTQELYQYLTNIAFSGMDCKPQYLCFECNCYMRRCRVFREHCLRADELLNQLILSGDGLSQESIGKIDRSSYKLSSKLTRSQIETIITLPTSIDTTINSETVDNKKETDILSEVDKQSQPEGLTLEYHNDNDKSDNYDNDNAIDDNESDRKFDTESDDDLPLKALSRKKKEKQIKVKRKGKEKIVKRGSTGFKEDFAKEVILTTEQQIAELKERATSVNYTNSPYKCEMCYKGFVDDTAFGNHMEKHDKCSGEFECPVCRLRYPAARQLRAHAHSVHSRKYDCVRCEHRSQTAHQAREHEKWHQGHIYECKLCGHQFKRATSYMTHLRKRHVSQHACAQCGDSFLGRRGLLMHTSKAHRSTIHEESGPASERTCAECNVQFVSAAAWRRHVLTSLRHAHRGGDACAVCGAAFPTGTELARHLKTHGEPRSVTHAQHASATVTLACASCPRRFVSASRLRAHARRVHLGLKYSRSLVCELCGRRCTSLATLRYHQRTHTGERPYPCVSCDKRFADSNQLRIHTRTHTDQRPYQCAQCDKRFRQRPALNRHMRVHTGVKPYACQYCQKSFTQSNSLKLHVRTVHFKLPPNNRRKKNQNPVQPAPVAEEKMAPPNQLALLPNL